MAAYPAFDQLLGSVIQYADDLSIDRSASGKARGRSFYTDKKAQITLKHLLTDTEVAALEQFYDDNKTLAVTLTWQRDGSSFTCLMAGPPQPAIVSGKHSAVSVALVEQ